VDHSVKLGFREDHLQLLLVAEIDMVKAEVVGKLRTNQMANPVDSFHDGIVEIVDNGNCIALF
jgi:hypothetical protein